MKQSDVQGDAVRPCSLTTAQVALLNPLANAPREPGDNKLESALRYAARGLAVFPCHTIRDGACTCGRPECGKAGKPEKAGKHPRTKNGVLDATTDEEQVLAWWREHPDSNVAVATGFPSRIVVLDVDPRHGGDEALEEMISEHGLLPDTALCLTGGGGRHFYFRHPGMPVKKVSLGPGLHLQGEGAYVICPPSDHVSGGVYVWEASSHPEDIALAPVPEWIVAAVSDKGHPGKRGDGHKDGAPILSGQRNMILTSLAGSMRRRGMSPTGILVALQAENSERCIPPLPDDEVRAIAVSVGRYAPAPSEPENLTDLGNARRLIGVHGNDLRFCHAWNRWLFWDGRHWAVDETGGVMRRAKDAVLHIYREASDEPDSTQRKAIAEHAKRSEGEARLRAMITLAQSEPGVPVSPADLDADPWKFNVQNGTLDLRTGDLLTPSRDDLLTKFVSVAFDPEARCPRWDAFLERIFDGDEDLIRFVQRAVGYSLTGSTREQAFFLLYGTGANGKSTFLEVLRALLGEYARTADFDTFLRKDRSGVPNDIARLAGARLVGAQEVEGGARLGEALVKQMTGRDTMLARHLYAEYFEFLPVFKLFLAANHKPVIRGSDHAIWRRTRLVPFTVTIPDEEQDRDLVEKLKGELPGILAWAVRGCLDWQREGLGSPAAVITATGEYRAESDILGTFLAECCVLGDAEKVAASGIYTSYKDWAARTGEQPVSQTAFGRQLGERGFVRRKSSGRNLWQGIGVAVGDGRDGLDGFPGKSYVREDKGKVARKPSNHPRTVPSDDANASPARDG